MPPDLPRPGDRLAGYRIERRLGHGATGVVYLARQEALDRPVALKVVGPPMSDDAAFRERFRREAHAAAALDHPNVVTVLDSGDDAEHLWLAMRLVDGPDLRVLLRRTGRLEPEQAVAVVEQVAAALDAAHAAGLVHRDVKPGNILVEDAPGRALHAELADFGLVGMAGGANGDPDDPEGTPGYAAPEQLAGDEVTAAADVYGLGRVLAELLTGTDGGGTGGNDGGGTNGKGDPCGTGDSDRKGDAGEARAGTVFPGPAFEAVIARATDPDPAVRYPTAGALAVAARAALDAPRPRAPVAAPVDPPRASVGALATPAEVAIEAAAVEAAAGSGGAGSGGATGPRAAAAVAAGAPAVTLVASGRRRRRWPWALPLILLLGVLAVAVLFIGQLGSGQFLGDFVGSKRAGTAGTAGSAGRGGAAGSGARSAAAGGETRARGGEARRAARSASGSGSSAGVSASEGGGGGDGSAGTDGAGTSGAAAAGTDGSGSGGTAALRSASADAQAEVPQMPASGPGSPSGSEVPPPAAGMTRFGGGTWTIDLPTSEQWRQTAVQELSGGRLLLTRLERPDGVRLIVEHRPGQTAVFGPWPGRPFVVRVLQTGRQTGLLFSGGRFEMCRVGTCAAVPVNGPTGGVLLLAGGSTAWGARRTLRRAAQGLRVG